MPRKQWVVVKAERPEDHDLIVVSGEEGGEAAEDEEEEEEDEDDEDDERGLASGRERDAGDFAISHVRTLSVEAGGRGDAEAQVRGARGDSSALSERPRCRDALNSMVFAPPPPI